MSDPKAEVKAAQAVSTASTLAAVYAAARDDVLRKFKRTGNVRDLLSDAWVELLAIRLAERAAEIIHAVEPDLPPESVADKVDAYAEWHAKSWAESVRESLDHIDVMSPTLVADVGLVMDAVVASAQPDAVRVTSQIGNFATFESAKVQGHKTKTWHTSGHPRSSHALIAGQTVPLFEPFGNGLQYPGAPGPPQEVAHCRCWITFGSEAS